jgi:hypothetical protein
MVGVTVPPPEGFRDPRPGDKRPRITPHWSNPMAEIERTN